MWLGRNVTTTLLEKTHDYFQTPEAFSRMVKVNEPGDSPSLVADFNQYAYMSHFFANPLAVLLGSPTLDTLSQTRLGEAIRNLPSFRM